MTTVKELKEYATEVIEKHPEHKKQIIFLLELCIDEIEEGNSIVNEVMLCRNDIEDIINPN